LKNFAPIILLLLFIPLTSYAQNSINPTNNTNLDNETVADIATNSKISWNVGIFAIIGSAITFIGILLTVRFLHIDKTHNDRIQKTRDDMAKILGEHEELVRNNQFTTDHVRWFAEYISAFYITIDKLMEIRRENIHNGARIDVGCMALLFLVGSIATTGIFENNFYQLLIVVGLIAFFPITHFIVQLKHTQRAFQFNRS